MQRAERWKTGAVLAGIVVIVLGACDAGEIVGDAMVDAGELVSDAGEWLRDGASNDAEAQVPGTVISMEVPCDVVREEVMSYVDTAQSRQVEERFTHWYAELSDARVTTSNVLAATVIACGRETFGADRAPTQCAPSADRTCTGDPPFPPLSCESSPWSAQIEDGLVRVYCGSRHSGRVETTSGSGTFEEWRDAYSQRFATARVSLILAD